MSNIAGKAYAMNVITPLRWYTAWITKLTFWIADKRPSTTLGLQTLSLIHYARWVVIKPDQFPCVSQDQPREELKYNYMLFFSNFNGSWDQYVDSFSSAIPKGLDMFWILNIKYPHSVPMLPFHRYITSNQIWTDHYYNAYPMAASNDVKAAQRVRNGLLGFIADTKNSAPNEFQQKYNKLLLTLQHDVSQMGPNPIVSLSAWAVEDRLGRERPPAGA
jgi:hypothetical protein